MAVARRFVRSREDFFLLAGTWTPAIQANENGLRFLVPTSDQEVGRHLYVDGAFDLAVMRDIMAFLTTTLMPTFIDGRDVVEVGANIGTTSVYALRLFRAATVHAFEPDPRNAEIAQLNALLNGVAERFALQQAAVSDRFGIARLALSPDNSGDHRVVTEGRAPDPDRDSIDVQTITLDDAVSQGIIDPARVGLIWIDAQGHEGHVLAGASKLLATGCPAVVEFWPRGLRRAEGLQKFTDAAVRHYTHFADIRRVGDADAFAPRPIDEIATHDAFYRSDMATDLVLWRAEG